MDERQRISNVYSDRYWKNNSRDSWIVNFILLISCLKKLDPETLGDPELPARVSLAQSVSIKKRFAKRFTAPGCFCIPQRDSSSFVVKLKYIRGVVHANPPFVSGSLLLIAKVVRTNRGRETEYRAYETTGRSIKS